MKNTFLRIAALTLILLPAGVFAAPHTEALVPNSPRVPTPLAPLSLVERELATVPADGAALIGFFREHVPSVEEGRLVVRSLAFLQLPVAQQRRVLEQLRERDPYFVLELLASLPFHLQGEIRQQVMVTIETLVAARFVRHLLEKLQMAAPILIVPAEFGQVTLTGRAESGFFLKELGLGDLAENTTFGDLFARAERSTSVYVPTADQGARQVL